MEDEFNFNSEKLYKYLFWIFPALVGLIQLFYISGSTTQIRYEELAESVRNVYWLDLGTIYDGVSSNVGWFGLLLMFYKVFGFSLFTAKFIKLFLFILSIFCLLVILKKFFDYRSALIVLLAVSLSPTILFFNILQTSYGVDFHFFIYSVFCLFLVARKKIFFSLILIFLSFVFAMVGWMSYPTFIYFLPLIFGLFIYKISSIKKIYQKVLVFVFGLLSFLSPLIIMLLYLKDPLLLLFDQKKNSGIFRGAGTINLNPVNFFNNTLGLLTDLFINGKSYYFESPAGDFWGLLPSLSFLTVLFLSIYLLRKTNKVVRSIILLTLFTFFSSLIISGLTNDPSNNPGIRRYTPFLISFYILFIVCWYYLQKIHIEKNIKTTITLILLIIPIQHLLVLPINLNALSKPSPYQYNLWFGGEKPPDEIVNTASEYNSREKLKLACKDKDNKDTTCRYQELFAAVAGSCRWNRLDCKGIEEYDDKKRQFIPLDIKLWEEYYWDH